MTEMRPLVASVLDTLKTTPPEVLYISLQHVVLDTWEDNGQFVASEEEFVTAYRQLEFLTTLYSLEWVLEQYMEIHNVLSTTPQFFKKKRAPEGMEQWEFDLLTTENDHLI